MGLHLGWIPNEPGLRAREYAAPAPGVPDPDSPEAAALRAAHAARALWTRLLIVVGLLAMILGPIGVAIEAVARVLNVVGIICDAVGMVLSGILTGLNGVVLAKQIGKGASNELDG